MTEFMHIKWLRKVAATFMNSYHCLCDSEEIIAVNLPQMNRLLIKPSIQVAKSFINPPKKQKRSYQLLKPCSDIKLFKVNVI